MNTLQFDSIDLRFGNQQILKSIHMMGRTGQIIGILGRNGCGKSCLLQVVFGCIETHYKSIRFNGRPLLGDYMSKRIIGYLPQGELIPPFITIEEARKLYSVDEAKLVPYLPWWGEQRFKSAATLSGGQRRWLEVLLVVFSVHPFCVLDEPFSGLSPLQVEKLEVILSQEKLNKGMFVTDHFHRSIRSLADEIYVLVNGHSYKIDAEEDLVALGYLNVL